MCLDWHPREYALSFSGVPQRWTNSPQCFARRQRQPEARRHSTDDRGAGRGVRAKPRIHLCRDRRSGH